MFKFFSTGVAVLALGLVASAPAPAAAARPDFGHYHEVHVSYSLHGWKNRHFHDHHKAHETANFLRSVGASVRIAHNRGRYDVIYACPRPAIVCFPSDRDAHRFARDLRRLGFKARVHH